MSILKGKKSILLNGSLMEIIDTVVFTAIGLMSIAIALEAYSYKHHNPVERIIIFVSALLMFFPNIYTHIAGLFLFTAVVVLPGFLSRSRSASQAA